MAMEEDRRHGKSNKRNFAYSTSGPAIRRRPPPFHLPLSFAYTSRTANNLTRTPTVGHLPYPPNKIPPVPGLSCNARVARGPTYLSVALTASRKKGCQRQPRTVRKIEMSCTAKNNIAKNASHMLHCPLTFVT